MAKITLACPHILTAAEAQALNRKHKLLYRGDGRFDVGDPCEAEIVLALAYEPADPEVGRREVYVLDEDLPSACPEGHTLTKDELSKLDAQAEQAAYSYLPPDDEP